MMSYVVKRKILSERLINMKDHEHAGIVKLLQDRKLLDFVSMVKPYSQAIVQEFYADLKFEIIDINSPFHHQVFVRNEMFEFPPLIIGSFLNTTLVKRNRVKELDLWLDMNTITMS